MDLGGASQTAGNTAPHNELTVRYMNRPSQEPHLDIIQTFYSQDMESQCLLGGCKLWTLAESLTHIIYGSIYQKLGLCVALLQSPGGEMSTLTSNLVFSCRIRFKIWGGELFLRWGEFWLKLCQMQWRWIIKSASCAKGDITRKKLNWC